AGTLGLVLNAVDSPRADDPGALTAAELRADRRQAAPRNRLFNAGEALTQQTLGATWTGAASAQREWRLRGWAVQRDFENLLPFDINSNGQGGAVDLDRDFHGIGVAHAWLPPAVAGAHRVVLGMDHELQRDRRRRFANDEGARGMLTTDQDEDVTATGVYLQDEWTPADAWRLTLGLRWDRVEFEVTDRTGLGGSGAVTFEEWSPLLGVNRALGDGLHAYANVARSFDTPTTTELANPDGPTGFNQRLDAQTATNYELGLKSRRETLRWELALFHIDVEDVLVPFEQAGSGQVFFENAGRSTRDGVEAAFEWSPHAQWTVSGALTWSDFRFDRFRDESGARFDGNEEPGIPRWNAWFGLRWEPLDSLELALDHRWVGAFFADNANRVKTDDYGITDLRGSWRFESGEWALTPHAGVNNLLDEQYNDNVRLNASFGRFFEPAPERNAYAGVTLERQF
ncbi:MAG: TonB-dependent receptor, partial [Xanthomonadales bacterium]|nr:TonB-dependent receptor [Xanthomonadales bacterium]